MVHRLIYWCSAAMAFGIQFVHINRVDFFTSNDGPVVTKQRRWFHGVLIRIGNGVFRYRHPIIEVLSTPEWLRWEQTIQGVYHQSAHQSPPAGNGDPESMPQHVLVRNRMHGRVLADLLQKTAADDDTAKIVLVTMATTALFELHRRTVSHGSRSGIRLSHGDATVRNVIVDLTARSATWFDFDVRHDLRASVVDRQADDLRAFLFSLASCCRWENIDVLFETVCRTYPSPQTWIKLQRQISQPNFRYDVFHLAQLYRARGQMSWRQTNALASQQKKLLAAIQT